MSAVSRIQNIKNHMSSTQADQVCIGDVCVDLNFPRQPERVPWQINVDLSNETILETLRWMLQKDLLGQDMFLLGNPGPLRRHLALAWCSLLRRECQLISLHRDTSAESDLKQRREIVRVVDVEEEEEVLDGEEVVGRRVVADAVTNFSRLRADWIDAATVDAAINGHVLIIEGVEKAERNVLPVLNNLLENREVNLEDGRQLVHPKFYDSLLQQGHTEDELEAMRLVRVHPQFRCIAIGVSVPPHRGNPLDPPFRSRFQCRWVQGHARSSTRFSSTEALLTPPLDSQAQQVMKDYIYLMETVAFSQRIDDPLSSSSPTNLMPPFSQVTISTLSSLIKCFPEETCPEFRYNVIERCYPYLALHGGMTLDQRKAFWGYLVQFRLALDIPIPTKEQVKEVVTEEGRQQEVTKVALDRFDYIFSAVKRQISRSAYTLESVKKAPSKQVLEETFVPMMDVNFLASKSVVLRIASGPHEPKISEILSDQSTYVPLPRFEDAVMRIIQAHAVGNDVCLVGPKGSGKSTVVKRFADILGYGMGWTESIFCYKDMTARDLLQRRGTRRDGSTFWEDSPLIQACIQGKLLILNDIEYLEAGTLASLSRLFQDREVVLPDGRHIMSMNNFQEIINRSGWSARFLMEERGIIPIHPSFRIIAIASTPNHVSSGASLRDTMPWLTEEVANMFQFVVWCAMEREEEQDLVLQASRCPRERAGPLFDLVDILRKSEDGDVPENADLAAGNALSRTVSLTTRQLIRICRRMANDPKEDLHRALHRAALYPFLSLLAKQALDQMLETVGIKPSPRPTKLQPPRQDWNVTPPSLIIDEVSLPIYQIKDVEGKALVPKVPTAFFDNDQHTFVMREMAVDLLLGSHLLLLGVQGVGKNRITDRLLELLNRPRNYIQLHRDTTVQQLLVQPTIEDGAIVYKDSPLIEAIIHGRVIVIDEADKAPVHITAILKSLAESGEMLLPDGRKILPPHASEYASSRDVIVHPDFRLFLLANRAGSSFMGNDFYSSIGDVFAVHCVENPDPESELQMVCAAAPDILPGRLRRLVNIFHDLREAFDNGQLQYPYSLRELLHVVRHLQRFPQDPVEVVLNNVFDFDIQRPEFHEILRNILNKQDVDTKNFGLNMMTKAKEAQRRAKRGSVELKFVKKAEVKPRDKSDNVMERPEKQEGDSEVIDARRAGFNPTAQGRGQMPGGGGGVSGGFRMDFAGGDPTEFSQELGFEVTDEMRQAALDNARVQLQQRLDEIGMEADDALAYKKVYSGVKSEIQQLRTILEGVKAKEKERVWLKNQTDGEIDDRKLIDGLTGEKAVYKRRGESDEPEMQKKPKRLMVLWDLSGSMYRFNGVDQRLTRSVEAAVMLMEALHGLSQKYSWQFYGHSGDGDWIPLVEEDKLPKNEAERYKIVQKMVAHAQFCSSGDSTFSCTKKAITEITKKEGDDYVVIVLSDANLGRYSLSASELGNILTRTDPRVNATCIFIGSAGEEANRLQKSMPPGKAFVCLTTSAIPNIIKDIFASTVV